VGALRRRKKKCNQLMCDSNTTFDAAASSSFPSQQLELFEQNEMTLNWLIGNY